MIVLVVQDEKNVEEFIQISDRPSTVSELLSIPKSNPIFSFPLKILWTFYKFRELENQNINLNCNVVQTSLSLLRGLLKFLCWPDSLQNISINFMSATKTALDEGAC